MKRVFSRFVPQSVKNLAHIAEAYLFAIRFGFPSRGMTIVGITGTDGKTTTASLLSRILEKDGRRVALASTVSFRVAGREKTNTSKFTTLGGRGLQEFLREAAVAGCTHAVLEVSSHALDQGRLASVHFDVVVITNVTREHLDYHRTMERYRRAKRKLFDRAGTAVVNLDMWDPDYFLAGAKRSVTYSISDPSADFFAEWISQTLSGSEFSVGGTDFRLRMPGAFNIENALAAISATSSLGVDISVAASAVGEVAGVPGRMEHVENGIGADILIDYAVTPDALGKLYELVSSMRKRGGKIVSVFGACGDRDRGKRPIMGEIVSATADIVILTDEDPYTEDPERILDEVEAGIRNKEQGKTLFRIRDRREAIRKGLALLSPGDILLVTGKGAEETMRIGDRNVLWNDRRAILEELSRIDSASDT